MGEIIPLAGGVLGALASSCLTDTSVWKNIYGCSLSAENVLTKNAATGWGNAGAVTRKSLSSGDGYIEFVTSAPRDAYIMFGLSNGDTDQNYTDVDFALALQGAPDAYAVYQFKNGSGAAIPGVYHNVGDVFRISVVSNVVRAYFNGALAHTFSGTPTYPLLVDTAFRDNGAVLNPPTLVGAWA